MLVNTFDRFIGQALLVYGEYSEKELELLRKFIAGPGTIVEIGGNNGSQTVGLAQAAAAVKADLVVFEPQPFLFQNLCANLALNALDNVTAWPFACGSQPGRVSFDRPDYRQSGNFGGVSMQAGGHGESVSVPIVRIDDLLQDKNVTLMKIDVEGFELEVLKGASATIQERRPVLYIENDRTERSEELISYLWRRGYQLWWHVTPLFNEGNYRQDRHNIYPGIVSYNMLCLPREFGITVFGLPEVQDSRWHPVTG